MLASCFWLLASCCLLLEAREERSKKQNESEKGKRKEKKEKEEGKKGKRKKKKKEKARDPNRWGIRMLRQRAFSKFREQRRLWHRKLPRHVVAPRPAHKKFT